MTRLYNFSAGPAMLSESVLQQAQAELLDWQGQGISIVEISHRSLLFKELLQTAEQDLRDLLAIPKNYHVLFMTTPARAQFSLLPMNLLGEQTSADYLISGIWSKMAADEAQRYAHVNVVADSATESYNNIPPVSTWRCDAEAAYFYYTSNETIHGVEFSTIPDSGSVPLVSDMTSSLLSAPIDISRFGLIFAGTQKNIGPPGLTIVIIRDDLLGKASKQTPTVYNYALQQEHHSLYYTPNSFSCYVAGLTFQWLKQQGGIEAIVLSNQNKAKRLYDCIDASNGFYYNCVAKENRSSKNITFFMHDPSLTENFLEQAEMYGLVGLKGHRLLGGMRASIYNSMPIEGVERLIDFMKMFAKH